MEDCSARLIVTTKVMHEQLSSQTVGEHFYWLEVESLGDECVGAEPPLANNYSNDGIAFLQYTSGSTSAPKGVMVTHANIIANQQMIREAFSHDEESTFVGWVPHYHDQGLIGNILQPMFIGATSVLMSPVTFMRWPLHWLKAISMFRAHTSGGPNFAFDACVAALEREPQPDLDLSSWQVAFNGAEPIRNDTLVKFSKAFSRFGFRSSSLYPCYGLAECTLLAAGGVKQQGARVLTVDRQSLCQGEVVLDGSTQAMQLVSSGKALSQENIAIVDPKTLAPCDDGRIGEIWISGPHVADGYWNRSEQTTETFCNYLLGDARKLFLRTGDLGFLHEGCLYVTGRLNDMVIVRGMNIYPQDIEQCVSQAHESLESAGCAVFSTQEANERLVIVQEIRREWRKKASRDEVTIAIRRAVVMDIGVTPDDIVLLMPGHLLKTSSGKVMRSTIRSRYMDNTLEVWPPKESEHQANYKKEETVYAEI